MQEKKRLSPLRITLAVLLGLIGGAGWLFMCLLLLFAMPYVQQTLPWIALAALILLVLLIAGAARKRWFRYVAAVCGAVIVGLGGYLGFHLCEESIPKMDDRRLLLYQYQPFSGERTTALPEEATLRFTKEQADSFVIDGATALYPVYAAFVQAVYPEGEYNHYDYSYDDRRDTVLCSGTTGAYEALISGEADVIFAAEPSVLQLNAAENAGLTLHMTPIGREAFVFFVNSRNPVTSLTFEQVQDIYAGEITNWREVGGKNQAIRAYQRDEGSGSQTAIQKIMRMGNKILMAPRTEDVVGSMGGVITQVAAYRNHRNAIGYTFRFYANEMVANDQIRLLSLNGVAPDKETIRDGSYPIASCFYAVTASPAGTPAPEEANADLKAFLDWCQGEQGQWLVEKVGYVSLN